MTDAEVEAVAADEQRRGGRRQHAAEQHLAARPRRRPAASAASSISPDSRVSRMTSTRGLLAGDDGRGGAAEREREVGREDLAGDAADAVGAEEPAGQGGASSAC